MKSAVTAALLVVPVTAGGALIGWTLGRAQVRHHNPVAIAAGASVHPEAPQVAEKADDQTADILEADAPPPAKTTPSPQAMPTPRPAPLPQSTEVPAPALRPAATPPPATPLPAAAPPAASPRPPGAVLIVVSLPSQRAFVFKNGEAWDSTRVSTGKARKRTPVGRYTILEKQVKHRSRTYDNAPMPYMQRLTWGGVALHAGHVPNFPASHGCIRLPWSFAKRLYGITNYSTVVVVTDKRLPSSSQAWKASHPQTADAG